MSKPTRLDDVNPRLKEETYSPTITIDPAHVGQKGEIYPILQIPDIEDPDKPRSRNT
jgi:hypothetical protein